MCHLRQVCDPVKQGQTKTKHSPPIPHAHAAETLLLFFIPGSKVLDVGSGSGYTCAIFRYLVNTDEIEENGPGKGKGKVVGIDHIPELVEWAVQNLRRDGLTLNADTVEMIAGDGRQGWPTSGPYDAIHVGAAAPVVPQPLIDQLARLGRMFIRVGESDQAVYQVDKDKDRTCPVDG